MTTKEEALEMLQSLAPDDYLEVLEQHWNGKFFNNRTDFLKNYKLHLDYLVNLEVFYRETRKKLEELQADSRDRSNHTAHAELVVALRDLPVVEERIVLSARKRLEEGLVSDD